jgi:hypothetical protein
VEVKNRWKRRREKAKMKRRRTVRWWRREAKRTNKGERK